RMADRTIKRRYNFTLDDDTFALLESIADARFGGNRSEAVRAAVVQMAASLGTGWVVAGFTAVDLTDEVECHCCHRKFEPGETLFRPVFKRGGGPNALPELPRERWLDCAACAGGHL
ncbi:MAG: ribbon-helix-helix domain-containing protein, partial [Fimbriimonadaceae bacterium]